MRVGGEGVSPVADAVPAGGDISGGGAVDAAGPGGLYGHFVDGLHTFKAAAFEGFESYFHGFCGHGASLSFCTIGQLR